MINKSDIDKGFLYYELDSKYKDRCYRCADIINDNDKYLNSFNKVFNLLNYGDINNIRYYWKFKSVDEIFCDDIDCFVTNLLLVLSYKTHQSNVEESKLDYEQILIHKKRVKECFQNDLQKRGYDSIRISQMLWAIYFIRIRIIEVGRLQYEFVGDSIKNIIKIHIPSGEKLVYKKVIESLKRSKDILQKIFGIKDFCYICHSWLLSNQLNEIIEPNTNINKFYKLFDVKDGDDCICDILNFVYSLKDSEIYTDLPDNTSLQKLIKQKLIDGEIFKLGIGILNNSIVFCE